MRGGAGLRCVRWWQVRAVWGGTLQGTECMVRGGSILRGKGRYGVRAVYTGRYAGGAGGAGGPVRRGARVWYGAVRGGSNFPRPGPPAGKINESFWKKQPNP